MRFLGIKRRKKDKQNDKKQAEIKMEMKELNVNPTPSVRADRNTARLERLKLKMKELPPESKRYKALKQEYDWRKHYAKGTELKGGK